MKKSEEKGGEIDHPLALVQALCGARHGARLRYGGFINAGIDIPRGDLNVTMLKDWVTFCNERIDHCITCEVSEIACIVWSYGFVDYFLWIGGYVEGNQRAARIMHLKFCSLLGIPQRMLTERDMLWDYRRTRFFKRRIAPLLLRPYVERLARKQNLVLL